MGMHQKLDPNSSITVMSKFLPMNLNHEWSFSHQKIGIGTPTIEEKEKDAPKVPKEIEKEDIS